MASTGKSTIAQTVAPKEDDRGLLGASFFFPRGRDDRGRIDRFFNTIAYQLAKRPTSLKKHIYKALAEQSDVAQQSLLKGWEKPHPSTH